MEVFGIAKCKGKVLPRFENLEKYKDLYERLLAKRLPSIQMLVTSGVRNYFCLNDLSLRICMVTHFLSRYFHFWENYLLKLAESLC